MRIVAGSAGGIPLVTPPGEVRPTMDKVRAAIFSRLAGWVPGTRVLDLFAGSGSLALEALSRGAESAVLVEQHAGALRTIETNLTRTRLAATVRREDVFAYLGRPAPEPPFDLILADPPYRKKPGDRDFAAELLLHQGLPAFLNPDGILVLEVYRGWAAPPLSFWQLDREKVYGESKVCYWTRMAEAETAL